MVLDIIAISMVLQLSQLELLLKLRAQQDITVHPEQLITSPILAQEESIILQQECKSFPIVLIVLQQIIVKHEDLQL